MGNFKNKTKINMRHQCVPRHSGNNFYANFGGTG